VGQCPTWWSPCRRQVAPSVQRRKVCLTPTTGVPCSNAAKMQNPLKFAGVTQTNETISAASGPKFTILWGHVEEILLLNKIFPIVDTCLSCEDIAPENCGMVPRWRLWRFFLRPVFSASRVQHVSDLHSKFTLCGSMTAGIMQGKKRKKNKEETTGWRYIWPALLHRVAIKNWLARNSRNGTGK